MSGGKPEFDHLSQDYEALLKDPIRDRFTGAASEFFHTRKRDLIRAYFRARGTDTHGLSYLDIGCGKGELLGLMREDFAQTAGCDPSSGMLEAGGLAAKGVDVRVSPENGRLPFDDASFDFVTAVCVYHHVPPQHRDGLTREAKRVLKPGGAFAIVEHNPLNPATRLIVSRTPVDADAILLRCGETLGILRRAGFEIDVREYFLWFPEPVYRRLGALEQILRKAPFGGQYAAFGRLPR